MGTFYSPELDVTYMFEHPPEGGLQVRARTMVLPVMSDDADGYWAGPAHVRPFEATGPLSGFLLDLGRVRNLRFERTGGPS